MKKIYIPLITVLILIIISAFGYSKISEYSKNRHRNKIISTFKNKSSTFLYRVPRIYRDNESLRKIAKRFKTITNDEFGGIITHSTKITNNDLKVLDGYIDITDLQLLNTKINDEGISYITSLENLTVLDLQNSSITNKSLNEISKLQKLNYR